MSNYTELLESYNLSPGETEWSGTRSFIQDPNGSISSLPLIGSIFPTNDAFSSDFPIPLALLCRQISITPYNSGSTGTVDAKYIYTCNYSTRSSFTRAPDPEDEPEDLSVGIEVEQLNMIGTSDGPQGGTSSKKIRQTIYVNRVVATYEKTQIYDTLQDALDTFNTQIGRVLDNGATPDEVWLSIGGDVTQFIDNDGDQKFECKRKYSYLRIDYDGNNYGWQYIWNGEEYEEFKTDGGQKLYTTVVAFTDTMPDLGP